MAQATAADGAPVLMWGSAGAHICIGQSQDPLLELAPRIPVPVVRRPLGGGVVWVDERQCSYVLIMPLALAPRRPADWSAWALQPAVAVFRWFGLQVAVRDGDLWLNGRKIAGSGAATIGHCAVVASSFLLRFPREAFAGCIAGSADFRNWLLEGLATTVTDWETHAVVPPVTELREAYAAAVGQTFGWNLQKSELSAAESAAVADAHVELEDDGYDGVGRRARAGGIKLNAESWLAERVLDGLPVRELVVRGHVARQEIISG